MTEPFRPDHRDRNGDLPTNFNDLPEDYRARLLDERQRLLHIHGAASWHDDVTIVGNRNALLVLRDAIDDALEKGNGQTTATVADGEGFGVVVTLNDAPWTSPRWETMQLPYTDPIASGVGDQSWKTTAEIAGLRQALRTANTMLVKRGVKPVEMPA